MGVGGSPISRDRLFFYSFKYIIYLLTFCTISCIIKLAKEVFKINKFDKLISLKDASSMFHKEESTLRRNIINGKFKENIDVKKFGKQWVFDLDSLEREYKK